MQWWDVMARFLNNLKQKTIAGSSGPSSSELQQAGQTIFLERPNVKDLEELMMVQAAHQLQTQNNGLLWPGKSSIIETSIPDGQTEKAVLKSGHVVRTYTHPPSPFGKIWTKVIDFHTILYSF